MIKDNQQHFNRLHVIMMRLSLWYHISWHGG